MYIINFRNDLFPCLLNNIFKLMPVEVLQDNKNKSVKLVEIFTTVPSFNFGGKISLLCLCVKRRNEYRLYTITSCELCLLIILYCIVESWTEWRLDHIVCWLYTNCLRHLPVLVRQWLSTADSRVSATIDKITSHYVSPMLCQEELLNNRLLNVENIQVRSFRIYILHIVFFQIG